MQILPSPMDLCSLSAVKSWLGITGSTQDNNLQACLTAASIFFLRYTGRGPRNWQNVTKNPFNEPVTYLETYDGISGNKLWLRNFPVNSISSLVVGGYTVPQSTGPALPGWVVDDQGRAVAIRNGGGGASPQTFQYVGRFGNGYQAGAGGGGCWAPFGSGPQSIQVDYIAGFSTIAFTDDLETILAGWEASTAYVTGDQISDGTYIQQALNSGTSGTIDPPWAETAGINTLDGTGATQIKWKNTGIAASPNTVTITQDATVLADNGVSYFSSGTPLDPVLIAPLVGQYFLVAPGIYLFNAGDAGQEVLIDYTLAGTPADIIFAIIQLVSLNYMRKNWIGQRSVSMKDVGSTSYTLLIDPQIREVMEFYKRVSLNS